MIPFGGSLCWFFVDILKRIISIIDNVMINVSIQSNRSTILIAESIPNAQLFSVDFQYSSSMLGQTWESTQIYAKQQLLQPKYANWKINTAIQRSWRLAMHRRFKQPALSDKFDATCYLETGLIGNALRFPGIFPLAFRVIVINEDLSQIAFHFGAKLSFWRHFDRRLCTVNTKQWIRRSTT